MKQCQIWQDFFKKCCFELFILGKITFWREKKIGNPCMCMDSILWCMSAPVVRFHIDFCAVSEGSPHSCM